MMDTTASKNKPLSGRLQTRILRKVILVVAIPGFLLVVAGYVGWQVLQLDALSTSIRNDTESLAGVLSAELDSWSGLLVSLSQDPDIGSFLEGHAGELSSSAFQGLYAALRERRLGGILSGFSSSPASPEFSTWKVPSVYREAYHGEGWGFLDLLDRNPGSPRIYRESLHFGPDIVSVLSMGIALPGRESRTYIVVNLLGKDVLDLFAHYGRGGNSRFFVTNAWDRSVVAQDVSWVNEFQEFKVPADAGRMTSPDGSSQVYSRSELPRWGLRVVGASSDHMLRESFRLGLVTIAALALLSCIVLLTVLGTSMLHITRPIQEVLDTMELVSKGDFKARMSLRSGDEFNQVSIRFNTIVSEMESLVRRLMAQVEQSKDAEMKQLQAQLNPHFLYNALDTVAWMVQMGETAKGLSMIKDMGSILRYSLERHQNGRMVPLREDLRLMQTYLHIHQLSMGERLRVVYDIDESCLDLSFPRLLLQPVIENAVVHGIADADRGTISIRIGRSGGMVEIVISDDGRGFDAGARNFDRDHWDQEGYAGPMDWKPPSSHIGLALVIRRAALHFGGNHRLEILSAPGQGTKVSLTVREEDPPCTGS